MEIKDLNFICTCGACPEQYEVYDGKNSLAYVRLRWGGLTCEVPDVGGECIYIHEFDDGLMGCFENEEQRKEYLGIIESKIKEYYAGISEEEYRQKLDECWEIFRGMEPIDL